MIESIRYELPKSAVAQYEDRWHKGLSNKCSSFAAGKMAELLNIHAEMVQQYDGIDSHCERLAHYLKKASRVKFERQHLRSVCQFFLETSARIGVTVKHRDELKKAATRGQKQFPDDPCFSMYLCDVEYGRGPRKANLARMNSLMDQALELAQLHPELAPPGLVDSIRKRQEEVEHLQPSSFFEMPYGMPFGMPSFGRTKEPDEKPIIVNGEAVPPMIRSMIEGICKMSGLSPEEVLKKISRGMPFPDE